MNELLNFSKLKNNPNHLNSFMMSFLGQVFPVLSKPQLWQLVCGAILKLVSTCLVEIIDLLLKQDTPLLM